MLGPEACEVMTVAHQAAMLAMMPCIALREAILPHPTMAGGLNTLVSNVQSRSDA